MLQVPDTLDESPQTVGNAPEVLSFIMGQIVFSKPRCGLVETLGGRAVQCFHVKPLRGHASKCGFQFQGMHQLAEFQDRKTI